MLQTGHSPFCPVGTLIVTPPLLLVESDGRCCAAAAATTASTRTPSAIRDIAINTRESSTNNVDINHVNDKRK